MGTDNQKLREAGSVNNAIAHLIAQGVEYGLKQVPVGIIRIVNEGLWRKFLTPLGHLVEYKENEFLKFCEAKGPYGLGVDLNTLTRICQSNTEAIQLIAACVEPQKTLSEAMKGNVNASKDKNSDYKVRAVYGNTQTYLIRRLKRDRPDIAERLARGEFKSARAAAIEARIVKIPTPLEELEKAWRKCSEEEKKRFLESLTTGATPCSST